MLGLSKSSIKINMYDPGKSEIVQIKLWYVFGLNCFYSIETAASNISSNGKLNLFFEQKSFDETTS